MHTSVISKPRFEEADYEEIRQCLIQLPHSEFRIIFLRFWGSRTIAQIAEELKMNWDAVDKRLGKALNTLRTLYGLQRGQVGHRSQAA